MNKKANKKDRHSQESLLGISLLYIVKQIGKIPHLIKDRKEGDPRYQHSGMTASFGFTLIELLVVVLIIGILSAIALPQYQKAVSKARTTEALAVLPTLVQASNLYYLANGSWPDDVSKLDVDLPTDRLSNNWAFGKEDNPRTYYFSLGPNGDWAANAADENLPLLHFEQGEYWCLAPHNKWGINKSDLAEQICKSMGPHTKDYDEVAYYQIK